MSKLKRLKKCFLAALLMPIFGSPIVYAASGNDCGWGTAQVHIGFSIGCNQTFENPILDATFAILRFLSVGVGLVVIISVIIAGIQFTMSQGNPQKAAEAIKRISNALLGLVIYIFLFAILQWLIPGGLF